MVDLDVNILAAWTVVLGFLAGGFHFAVLKPLNKAIENLDNAIGELRTELQTTENRRHELELKVVEVDQRARVAHRRLDEHIRIMHENKEGGTKDDVEHR